jgi:hypothetical protein
MQRSTSKSGVAAEVELRKLAQRDVIAQARRRGQFARREQLLQQRIHFAHQSLHRHPDPVPLQHRELGIVLRAALGAAEHLAQLVDIAAAGGQ